MKPPERTLEMVEIEIRHERRYMQSCREERNRWQQAINETAVRIYALLQEVEELRKVQP